MREQASGTREVLEEALRSAKLPRASELMSFDDSEAILQVVASGIGAACLSRLLVAGGLRSKRLIAPQAAYLKLNENSGARPVTAPGRVHCRMPTMTS